MNKLDNYHKEKYNYIKKVREHYGSLAVSVGFWKLSKIKKVYPL